jgi:O-antigen/teichoic acid export membrane protein
LANKLKIKQLSWSFLSGIIGGLSILIATSVIIRLLGYNSFGVISIWIFLQTIIQIFDMGVGGALNRELTDQKIDKINIKIAALYFYRLSGVTWFLTALLVVVCIYEKKEIALYLLMILALSLQFQTIYDTAILASKFQYEKLAKAQIAANISKYGGACLVVIMTNSLIYFFVYQVFAAVVSMLVFKHYSKINVDLKEKLNFLERIKDILKIKKQSISMWGTSIVSIALTSIDRTLIGLIDNAESLGKYTTAVTAASMLSLVTLPYYRVYYSEYASSYFNDKEKLESIFVNSCSQLTLLLTVIGVFGYVGADFIFYLWLGVYDVKQIDTFRVMLIGMTFANITWLPGALCQAAGKASIHTWIMITSIVFGAILAKFGIDQWGYTGGAVVWIVHGLIGVLIEPYIIDRFVININLFEWYRKVFLIPLSLIAIIFSCIKIYD